MTELVERVKIKNCESNIPGVRIDTLDTEGGSMRGVIFRAESDAIINGITKLVKSTFQDDLGFYEESLHNFYDSDSAVSDIFNYAAGEAEKRHEMACNRIYVQIMQDTKDDKHYGIIDVSSKDTRPIIDLKKAAKKWDWNHSPEESYNFSEGRFIGLAPDIYYNIFTAWGYEDATHHIEFRLTGPRAVKKMIDFLRNIYGDIPIHKYRSE